jgi:hypothetical protein
MKRLMLALLAAAGLAVMGGRCYAEGTGTKYDGGYYSVYRSSDAVLDTTGQNVVAGPVILHKIIVSSPSYNVDVSTNAVFQIQDAQSGTGGLRAEVNLSTQSISGPTEYTFDIALSSGFRTDFQGTGTNGKVTAIYSRVRPASPQGYRVWSSTYMPADTGVHRIALGPVLLHKIIVLTKGTGTAILTAYDSYVTASPATSRRVAAVDLTDTAREYTYDILCSSGITIQSSGAGTVVPSFILLYKQNPSQDYEVWRGTFTTGTATTAVAAPAPGWIFGGVLNGDSVSGSFLTVYNSSGSASNIITKIDGVTSFDRKMYDVQASSGITYSSSGNGLFTILFKRR